MKHLFVSALVWMWVACLMVGLARGDVRYTVTDIGTLGGVQSFAYGINNLGEVVGQSSTSGEMSRHAFLYSRGVMKDLGTLGLDESFATAINDTGEVVGMAQPAGSRADRAFRYSDGQTMPLSGLGGITTSRAYAINNSGQIVGLVFKEDASSTAFLYSNGRMTSLDVPGTPYDINDSGQITGEFPVVPGESHAFLYSGGTLYDLLDRRSVGYGINSKGQVVGQYDRVHAFLYSDGQMTAMDMRIAYAINDRGQVVGGKTAPDNLDSAMLYEDGVVSDLNTLIDPGVGWRLNLATAINEPGQIAGIGTNPSGLVHGFILTPVPEPGILWLLAGVVGLLGRPAKSNC